MTTADLIPQASVYLISNSGGIQTLTDSLVVPSLTFGRSSSDLVTTASFAVRGAYDITLSPPQFLAIEYESVVRFHGVITNCTINWSGGIPTTSIEASDMTYLLSHKLVPILAADWAAVTGMIGPCDFGTMTADQIVEALCTLCSISGGSLVSTATAPVTSCSPGTYCLDFIKEMGDKLGFVFFLYFTKVSGVYTSNAYFGLFSGIDSCEVL